MGLAEQTGRWREWAHEVRVTQHKPAARPPGSQGCLSGRLGLSGPARVPQGRVVWGAQGIRTNRSLLVGKEQSAVAAIHVGHADVVPVCPVELPAPGRGHRAPAAPGRWPTHRSAPSQTPPQLPRPLSRLRPALRRPLSPPHRPGSPMASSPPVPGAGSGVWCWQALAQPRAAAP